MYRIARTGERKNKRDTKGNAKIHAKNIKESFVRGLNNHEVDFFVVSLEGLKTCTETRANCWAQRSRDAGMRKDVFGLLRIVTSEVDEELLGLLEDSGDLHNC
jgi:hypothetical protein